MRVKRFDILRRPGLEAGSLARLPVPARAAAASAPLIPPPRTDIPPSPAPLPPPAGPAREEGGGPSAPPASPAALRPLPAPKTASLRPAVPPAAGCQAGLLPTVPSRLCFKKCVFSLGSACLSPCVF